MKRTIIILSAAILVAGTLFTGCQSTSQKQEAAQKDVRDARENLNDANQEANSDVRDARENLNEAKQDANEIKLATAEEWATFKRDSDVKIRANEARIVELNNGRANDVVYSQRVADLELKNKDFRTRLNTYENNQTNWDSFKRDFNRDMDNLGKSLKDFTVDNTK